MNKEQFNQARIIQEDIEKLEESIRVLQTYSMYKLSDTNTFGDFIYLSTEETKLISDLVIKYRQKEVDTLKEDFAAL